MQTDLLQTVIYAAHKLADLSGAILLNHFRQSHLRINSEAKADESPVTQADKEAEAAMRHFIGEYFPEHGIIGEEYQNSHQEAEYLWVLDPIDGTKNFMSGQPLFTTLIALLRNGKPVLGLINQPTNAERWFGLRTIDDGKYRKEATLGGTPVQSSSVTSIANATLSTTSPYLFDEQGRAFFEKLRSHAQYDIYGSDGYGYAMLASGHLDAVVESGLKPHDVMALIPVIEGAGGTITDWQGNPIRLQSDTIDVIAAATPELHREILNVKASA